MGFLKEKNANTRLRVRGIEMSFAGRVARICVRVVFLVLLCTFIWYVVRLPIFTITRVAVQGGETISHDALRQIVETKLQGMYFFSIPKAFRYVYPKKAIIAEIMRDDRIYDVDVQISADNVVMVSFEEYIPEALWCIHDVQGACYFLDAQGFAFSIAPPLQGGTFLRFIFTWKDEYTRGFILDPVSYGKLHAFITRVEKSFNVRISEVMYDVHDDVTLVTNGGGKILASAIKDYDETFNNLSTILTSPEFQYLAPGNFKYIDVRFDNKVFVNEEMGTTTEYISTTTTSTE